MDNFSISNTLSRASIYESNSVLLAYREDEERRISRDHPPEAISNEEIRKDDLIMQTYRVEEDAVHGGMGSVWKVLHQGWNVSLAMKRPQPRFFAEGSDQRKWDFIMECEHWIGLGLHPNIVSCYYVRDIGGVPTIFSEWMDGGSLKDAIRTGRLYEGAGPEVQARIPDIAVQAVRGLEYAHRNNLVHQDIKPGNLLLTKEWDARVADFGLAKTRSFLSDGAAPFSSGYTPEYCPEEQAEGAPAEPWMDVYAWALTVLEMYAGTRLWKTGAEAKEHLGEYFPLCRIPVPDPVRKVLTDCISGTVNSFQAVEKRLADAYKAVTGHAYPRPAPKAAPDTADSLNNRALSWLDLGNTANAEACWEEALKKDAEAENSIYNYALYRWRFGKALMPDVLNALGRITDRKERDAMQKDLFREAKARLVLRAEHEAEPLCSGPEPLRSRNGRLILDGTELLDAETGKTVVHCSFPPENGIEFEAVYRAFLNDDRFVLVVFLVRRQWAEAFYLGWIWNAVTGQALSRAELESDEYRVEDGVFFLLAAPEEMHVEEGPRAPYRLNAVRSVSARLEEQDKYAEAIRNAKEALQNGSAAKAMELADLAASLPGFESEPEPVRIRAAAGRHFRRTGVRRVLRLPPVPLQADGSQAAVPDSEKYTRALETAVRYVHTNIFRENPENPDCDVRAVPVQLSRDRQFLLIDLEIELKHSSRDLMHRGLDGFALADLQTGRIVLCERKLFAERYEPRDERSRRILCMNDDASFVLAAEKRILRIIRVRSAEILTALYVGPFLYAGFLPGAQYVLTAGTDADNRGEKHFLDLVSLADGAVAYEGVYPDHLVRSIRPVSADQFETEMQDGNVSVCLIDWEYSTERRNSPCRIEIGEPRSLPLINRQCSPSDLEICRQVLKSSGNGFRRKVFRCGRNELYALFMKLQWEWTLEPWGLDLLDRNREYEVRFIPVPARQA